MRAPASSPEEHEHADSQAEHHPGQRGGARAEDREADGEAREDVEGLRESHEALAPGDRGDPGVERHPRSKPGGRHRLGDERPPRERRAERVASQANADERRERRPRDLPEEDAPSRHVEEDREDVRNEPDRDPSPRVPHERSDSPQVRRRQRAQEDSEREHGRGPLYEAQKAGTRLLHGPSHQPTGASLSRRSCNILAIRASGRRWTYVVGW